MSIKVMAEVWQSTDENLTATQRFVLLKFADCAHDDGSRSFPSYDIVARQCNLSRATIERAVSELRSRGYLELMRQSCQHEPAMYKVHAQGPQIEVSDENSGTSLSGVRDLIDAAQGPHPVVKTQAHNNVLNHHESSVTLVDKKPSTRPTLTPKEVLTEFAQQWKAQYRVDCTFERDEHNKVSGKTLKGAKKLGATYPVKDKLSGAVRRYLADSAVFFRGHPFSLFAAHADRFAADPVDTSPRYDTLEEIRAKTRGGLK